MALHGHCLCGSVTYSCDAEPVVTGICHRTDCQRQTGTAFSVVIAVPADRLEVRGDTLRVYPTVGEDHGTRTNRHFCAACGSPVVSRIEALPELAFIKAGTLDDTSRLEPTIEWWGRSAQAWVSALAGGERLERGAS